MIHSLDILWTICHKPHIFIFCQNIQIILYDTVSRVKTNMIVTTCKSFSFACMVLVFCGCLVTPQLCLNFFMYQSAVHLFDSLNDTWQWYFNNVSFMLVRFFIHAPILKMIKISVSIDFFLTWHAWFLPSCRGSIFTSRWVCLIGPS